MITTLRRKNIIWGQILCQDEKSIQERQLSEGPRACSAKWRQKWRVEWGDMRPKSDLSRPQSVWSCFLSQSQMSNGPEAGNLGGGVRK